MLRTNESELVELAVQGAVMHPKAFGWEVSHLGEGIVVPSVGGITYNVKIGDAVFGLAGDHIEAGVSFTATPDKLGDNPNRAFNAFSCIGNRAILISGKASGSEGVVTGQHGGVEHVLVDFDDAVLERMTNDDKVLIRACGLGLKLLDYPGVKLYSTSPRLLDALDLRDLGDGRLEAPVAAEAPAQLMGSGLGHNDVFKGDYDIQTSDMDAIRRLGLDRLRFGDIVAIRDQDSSYGWSFKEGAVTLGVVVHSDSYLSGHGPGTTTIMTCREPHIVPRLDANANIGYLLRIGRWRPSVPTRRRQEKKNQDG